jgi:hypothetical protein
MPPLVGVVSPRCREKRYLVADVRLIVSRAGRAAKEKGPGKKKGLDMTGTPSAQIGKCELVHGWMVAGRRNFHALGIVGQHPSTR